LLTGATILSSHIDGGANSQANDGWVTLSKEIDASYVATEIFQSSANDDTAFWGA
jgi:hypothetical protein